MRPTLKPLHQRLPHIQEYFLRLQMQMAVQHAALQRRQRLVFTPAQPLMPDNHTRPIIFQKTF